MKAKSSNAICVRGGYQVHDDIAAILQAMDVTVRTIKWPLSTNLCDLQNSTEEKECEILQKVVEANQGYQFLLIEWNCDREIPLFLNTLPFPLNIIVVAPVPSTLLEIVS